MEFDKIPRQFLPVNMIQAEFLHAGGVDNAAVPIHMVEPCMGSSMPAGIERDGNSGSSAFRSWNESVDQGGFTHAGLTYQNTEVTLQVGQKWRDTGPGADLQQGVAKVPVECERGGGSACGFSKVGLVEYDQRLDALVLGSGEAAVHQFFTEAGHGRHYNDYLGDIGSDEFLAIDIAAVQERATRQNSFYYALS